MKPALLRLIVLFCVFCIGHTTLQAQTPHPDIAPLTALYNATNGPNWTNKTKWLSDNNPCGWYGVTCTANRVTRVSLEQNNLVGTIPSEIGNLSDLEVLILHINQLSGTIPKEIGKLRKLKWLWLRQNQISGSIPIELSNLSELFTLSLEGNQLTGEIPPQLGFLTNLQELRLYKNQLSGSIPSELGNLTQLQYLYLQNNQLSGCFPANLHALCGITVLLYGNSGLPSGGGYEAWDAFCSTGAGSNFTAVASTPTPITCVGATINLSVSGGTSHSWSGPNGFTASVQNPNFVANSQSFSSIYTVTANNGGGACSVIATVSVSVKVSPNILAKSNSPVCVGSSINLSTATTDTNLKYQWSK